MKKELSKCAFRDNLCRKKIRDKYSTLSLAQDQKLIDSCKGSNQPAVCRNMIKDSVWYLSTGVHGSYNNEAWNLWGNKDRAKESVQGLLALSSVTNPVSSGYVSDEERRATLMMEGISNLDLEKLLASTGLGATTSLILSNISPKNAIENIAGGIKNLSRIRKVNNRSPINSVKYANTTIPLEDLPKDVRNKYPRSVHFSGAGYPDFTPYAVKKTQIDLTGSRSKDFQLANEAVGLKSTPKDYTWHHHQDSGLMQLVPSDLHDAVKHTGGVATSGLPYK